jgi:hypothetical protein
MSDLLPTTPPLSDRSGVTDAVRAQILATEHWSLLATRSMSWNEVFSRAGIFITVVSATVVALALVAQATDFGSGFRAFALLALPVVLLVGLMTQMRLSEVSTYEVMLVVGMNRLRHAYLELAPELEPYFVTGSHDDEAGILQTFGVTRLSAGGFLSGTHTLVAAINIMVLGIFAVLVAQTLGASVQVALVAGVSAALAATALLATAAYRSNRSIRRTFQPRFPR